MGDGAVVDEVAEVDGGRAHDGNFGEGIGGARAGAADGCAVFAVFIGHLFPEGQLLAVLGGPDGVTTEDEGFAKVVGVLLGHAHDVFDGVLGKGGRGAGGVHQLGVVEQIGMLVTRFVALDDAPVVGELDLAAGGVFAHAGMAKAAADAFGVGIGEGGDLFQAFDIAANAVAGGFDIHAGDDAIEAAGGAVDLGRLAGAEAGMDLEREIRHNGF